MNLRDVAIGVAAGALIGAGAATADTGNFVSHNNFTGRTFQLGFAAGVADAVGAIVDRKYSDGTLRNSDRCFTRFENLGRLTDWVLRRVDDPENGSYSIASIMIVDGAEKCDDH
jgi:hypothetical protein